MPVQENCFKNWVKTAQTQVITHLKQADFQNQLIASKVESLGSKPGNQQLLCNMVLDLMKEIRESRKEIHEMRSTFNAVVLENASHKATISTMANEMNNVKHRLHIAESKVSRLHTPPPPPQQKRSLAIMGSPDLHNASDESKAYAEDFLGALTTPTFSPLIDVPALPPQKLALQYSYELAMVAKHAGNAKPMHYLCSRCKGCLIFMGV